MFKKIHVADFSLYICRACLIKLTDHYMDARIHLSSVCVCVSFWGFNVFQGRVGVWVFLKFSWLPEAEGRPSQIEDTRQLRAIWHLL